MQHHQPNHGKQTTNDIQNVTLQLSLTPAIATLATIGHSQHSVRPSVATAILVTSKVPALDKYFARK